MQLDLTLRVDLHETADQQGGQVVTDGQGSAHCQGAKAGLAVEQVFDFLGLIEQCHGLGQQLMTQGVEAQTFAGTVKQLTAGLALKFGDRGTGGRLR
ncbi:hypothetical protein D3C72_2118100 [compost metagenome]